MKTSDKEILDILKKAKCYIADIELYHDISEVIHKEEGPVNPKEKPPQLKFKDGDWKMGIINYLSDSRVDIVAASLDSGGAVNWYHLIVKVHVL